MTQPSNDRVMEVLGDALEAAPPQRRGLLDSLCGEDGPLRAEVERLLKLEDQAAAALPDDVDAGHLLGGFSTLREHLRQNAPCAATIPPGTTIGAYRFDDILGQGGMGVVYRAMDTRLDRPVAIKALPPSLVADASRLGRFVREAKLLGSLSHPNVATVFGLEETGDAKYLVMELIEGETLTARLLRSNMTIPEALAVAAQIAAGLSCAHEAGVVHRDLKPGNIMLAPDGKAKLLDFGLARETPRPLVDEDSRGIAESDVVVTREGSVLGTPRYMSPEQVRGLAVDRRTDVFSFGCVLYEMLTGEPPFQGKDRVEVAAAILEREPDFAALPARTPTGVRRVLRRMLVKDAAQRLRDLGDVRIELEEALAERSWLRSRNEPARGAARRLWPVALAAVLGVAAAAQWFSGRSNVAPVPVASEHFVLPFPNNHEQTDLARLRLAISRDGEQIILSASDGKHLQLWRRLRGETSFSSIPDTLGAWIPALSPDGEWVAYYQDGYLLRRRLNGGEAVRVAGHASYAGRISWSANDEILFTPFWSQGVARVPSVGGQPRFLTKPDYKADDAAHMSPAPTPDNRAVLFTIWDGEQGTRIDAVARDGSQRHNVVENGECPRIVATPRGPYLLYTRRGTLFAAPFDQERCRRGGPEQAVVDDVLFNRALFEPTYDVADDGTLAYVAGPALSEQSRLAWLAPDGSTTPLNDERGSFAEPHLSSDGSRLSVLVKGEVYQPHLLNLVQGTIEPIVTDSDTESAAISPDGRRLAYACNRRGRYELWLRDLETRSDRVLTGENATYQNQICWSHDSRFVAFAMTSIKQASWDVWVADLQTDEVRPFCDRPAEEHSPQFSPDGRWLAYSSDETGNREIRLRRFPDGSLDRQVTTAGGADWAQWSPDGKTLYYRRNRKLWSAPISLEDGSATGPPVVVYDRDFGQADFELADYLIAPDGRILLVEPSERGPRVSAVHVVLNWYALLDR